MTTYTVKNGSPVDKAFKVDGGHEIVARGKRGEVTTTEPLTEAQISALELDGVDITEKKAGKGKPEQTDKEVIDGLSVDDKAAYDKLDEAGKAKFIADKKAA